MKVTLGSDLKKAIVENAKALFSKRIANARPDLTPDQVDVLYRMAVPKEVELALNTLPGGWLQAVSTMTVNVKNPYAHHRLPAADRYSRDHILGALHDTYPSQFSFNLTIPRPLAIPRYTSISVQASEITSGPVHDWAAEHGAVLHEYGELLVALRPLFNEATTLKHFLEMWPQGTSLIPNDVMNKHYAKPERGPRASPVPKAKLTEINTTILTQKLLGT